MFLKIILTAIFIIIIPIAVIPLLFSVINYLPEIFLYFSFGLGREFFTEIQLNSYLSLYLSIVSIMVSVIIAYYLYKLEVQQKRKERDQELEQNKEMVFYYFDKAVTQTFKSLKNPSLLMFDPLEINEDVFVKVSSIKPLLSDDQFMLLNKIMNKYKDAFDSAGHYGSPVVEVAAQGLIELIDLPAFSTYSFHLKNAESVYSLFNPEAVELYNLLAPASKGQIYTKDRVLDKKGNVILKKVDDNIIVYNSEGQKLCEAKFDAKGVIEGNAEIFDKEGNLIFAGDFKDHHRNGDGIEYHPDGIKAKEGIWKDGKLVDGFIYDVLLADNKTLFNDEIKFLVDSYSLISMDSNDELLVGCLKVEAGETIIAQETIKDAAEVWDEYYDDKLA